MTINFCVNETFREIFKSKNHLFLCASRTPYYDKEIILESTFIKKKTSITSVHKININVVA